MYFRRVLIFLLLLLVACTPVEPTPYHGPTPTLPPHWTPPGPIIPSVTPSTADSAFLPNKSYTPGALNNDVTQDTINTTICVPGYSSSIRPPVSYTDALKINQIALYGYSDTNPADYEEDHFIPLSVGGNPTDPRNLWPQPRSTQPYNATVKDTLEYKLYKDVCAGTVSLADAQRAIVTDWVEAYRKYVTPNFQMPFLAPEP